MCFRTRCIFLWWVLMTIRMVGSTSSPPLSADAIDSTTVYTQTVLLDASPSEIASSTLAHATGLSGERRIPSLMRMVVPTLVDFKMSLMFLLVILFLRVVVPHSILVPVIRGRVKPASELQNACDHFMKFVFHSLLFIWGIKVLRTESWLKDTWHPAKDIWVDFPFSTLSAPLQLYYQAQFAFYISGTIFHFLEVRRKDFWVMIFHHLCSAGLIFFSYVFCFHRIGSIVLITREFSDIFLHFTKVAVFLGKTNYGLAGFLTLMISWVPLRLVMFPFCILYSTWLDSIITQGREHYHSWRYHYWGFNLALTSLVPLDWYYFYVGLQIGYRRAKTGSLKDTLEKTSPTVAHAPPNTISSHNKFQ